MSIRKALVTGGSRGIGAAIASKLSGPDTVVHITSTTLESPHTIKVNYEDDESFQSLLFKIQQEQYDIIINNVGINIVSDIRDASTIDLEKIMKINFQRSFEIISSINYKKENPIRIINISSISGTQATAGRSMYCSSKHAMIGMTKAAALDLADRALINCVSPGPIVTDLTKDILGDTKMKELEEVIPLGRLGSPEEVAELVNFLCSSGNTYITGQNFIIDGGLSSKWI